MDGTLHRQRSSSGLTGYAGFGSTGGIGISGLAPQSELAEFWHGFASGSPPALRALRVLLVGKMPAASVSVLVALAQGRVQAHVSDMPQYSRGRLSWTMVASVVASDLNLDSAHIRVKDGQEGPQGGLGVTQPVAQVLCQDVGGVSKTVQAGCMQIDPLER